MSHAGGSQLSFPAQNPSIRGRTFGPRTSWLGIAQTDLGTGGWGKRWRSPPGSTAWATCRRKSGLIRGRSIEAAPRWTGGGVRMLWSPALPDRSPPHSAGIGDRGSWGGWKKRVASLAKTVGEETPWRGKRALPRPPVPLRGRAGSAAIPPDRLPGAVCGPCPRAKDRSRAGPQDPAQGREGSGPELGGASGSRSAAEEGAVGGARPGAGPMSAVGGARRRGAVPAESPRSAAAAAPPQRLRQPPAPGLATLAAPCEPPRPPLRPESLHSPRRSHPGAARLAVTAEAASGAHLEPPGRPRWIPRPPWPGRAGSPARSWSRTWSRGPWALSRAAGAW